jgi:hypothetical protein
MFSLIVVCALLAGMSASAPAFTAQRNLTEASVTAAKSSYGLTMPIVALLAGSYGLRAWRSAVVHFQRVTAGPVV